MEERQEFEYSDEQVKKLVRGLSLERLQPYLYKARDDRWVAIQLYVRNTEISESLYGVLQGLEVLLRNAIHHILTKHFGTEGWYFQLPLREPEMKDIEEAEDTVSSVRSTWLRKHRGDFLAPGTDLDFVVKPGRVVAALSFGFWVKLFANAYEYRLWAILKPLFPQGIERATLHGRLMEIKTLRNRLAHHETLIKRNVEKDYRDLLETIGWISPMTRDWIKHENRFPAAFAKTLRKKPKRPETGTTVGEQAMEVVPVKSSEAKQ